MIEIITDIWKDVCVKYLTNIRYNPDLTCYEYSYKGIWYPRTYGIILEEASHKSFIAEYGGELDVQIIDEKYFKNKSVAELYMRGKEGAYKAESNYAMIDYEVSGLNVFEVYDEALHKTVIEEFKAVEYDKVNRLAYRIETE